MRKDSPGPVGPRRPGSALYAALTARGPSGRMGGPFRSMFAGRLSVVTRWPPPVAIGTTGMASFSVFLAGAFLWRAAKVMEGAYGWTLRTIYLPSTSRTCDGMDQREVTAVQGRGLAVSWMRAVEKVEMPIMYEQGSHSTNSERGTVYEYCLSSPRR